MAILAKGKLEPKYFTIQHFKQEKNWDISWMCKQLNVSRAGYYKWINREKPAVELENEQIALWIKEYDEKFKHTLGYRRMRNYINRDKNKHYSKRRIQRIMRVFGIKSIIRKQRKPYRHSTPQTTAENTLQREFEATKPNEKWATDVTEFKVPMSNKKVYLSAIIDFYDRSVVSYVLSNRNDNKLVFETYELALKKIQLQHHYFIATEVFSIQVEYFKRSYKSKELNNPCLGGDVVLIMVQLKAFGALSNQKCIIYLIFAMKKN